ncbi:MAG: hypothetical protein ACYTXY_09135 [Nostoc sp.]
MCKEYLLNLLSDWKDVQVKHYEILNEQTASHLKEFGGVREYSLTNLRSQSVPNKPSFGILLF